MAEYIRRNRTPIRDGNTNVMQKQKKVIQGTRKSFQKPKKRIRKKRLRLIRYIVILVVLLSTVLFVMLYTPLFNIGRIEVVGNKNVSTANILKEAKIPQGKNVFRFSEGGLIDKSLLTWAPIEKRLADKFVAIESIKVSYLIGGKVTILIHERVPLGWIKVKEDYLLLDEKGMILKKQDQPQEGIYLTGLKAEGISIGENLVMHKSSWASLLRVIDLCKNQKGMPFSLTEDIKSFDMSKEDKLSFRLKNGILVVLGDVTFLSNPDIIYRFQYIKSVVNELKDKHSGVIDCSNGDVVYRP